jgi:rubredoxin
MSKIKCQSCGWVGDTEDMLSAQSPFKPAETIYACPQCKEIEQVAGVDKPWTDLREKQLKDMENLLWTIRDINCGGRFIENITKAISIATELLEPDFESLSVSFVSFVQHLVSIYKKENK